MLIKKHWEVHYMYIHNQADQFLWVGASFVLILCVLRGRSPSP